SFAGRCCDGVREYWSNGMGERVFGVPTLQPSNPPILLKFPLASERVNFLSSKSSQNDPARLSHHRERHRRGERLRRRPHVRQARQRHAGRGGNYASLQALDFIEKFSARENCAPK